MKNLFKKLFTKQKPKGWFNHENVASYVEVGDSIQKALHYAEGKPSGLNLYKDPCGGTIRIRWEFREKGKLYYLAITGQASKLKGNEELEGEPDHYLDYVIKGVTYESI